MNIHGKVQLFKIEERHRSVQCSSAMDLTDHCSFAMTNDTKFIFKQDRPVMRLLLNHSATFSIIQRETD